jgi:lipid-binding SYLF domain-containing protein
MKEPKMLQSISLVAVLAVASVIPIACATAPESSADKRELQEEAEQAAARARQHDNGLAAVMDAAHAYAVFPKVGKGAAGVGGAYGKGVVFQDDRVIGYCDVTQATVGAQLGGQTYTEIVCFESPQALQHFKDGELAFDAQATAVAIDAGTGANVDYRDGVAVFTTNEKGLMAEASVGGQKFSYEAL